MVKWGVHSDNWLCRFKYALQLKWSKRRAKNHRTIAIKRSFCCDSCNFKYYYVSSTVKAIETILIIEDLTDGILGLGLAEESRQQLLLDIKIALWQRRIASEGVMRNQFAVILFHFYFIFPPLPLLPAAACCLCSCVLRLVYIRVYMPFMYIWKSQRNFFIRFHSLICHFISICARQISKQLKFTFQLGECVVRVCVCYVVGAFLTAALVL